MADGLLFFNDGPNDFIQKMSKAEDEIDGNVREILSEVVDEAVKLMRQSVISGGENKTQKGGARVDSGAMISSIDGNVRVNGRGRVQAEFGFIDGPPEYTMYQERGTRHVPPMLAYAEAQVYAFNEIWNKLDTGRWIPQSLRF